MLTQCNRRDEDLDALLRSLRARANPDPTREDTHAAPAVERTDTTDSNRQMSSGRLPVHSVSSFRRRALPSTRCSVLRPGRLADNNSSSRRLPRLNRT